jgi:hypothetical protein
VPIAEPVRCAPADARANAEVRPFYSATLMQVSFFLRIG